MHIIKNNTSVRSSNNDSFLSKKYTSSINKKPSNLDIKSKNISDNEIAILEERILKYNRQFSLKLRIEYDKSINSHIISLVDTKKNEVIRQQPSFDDQEITRSIIKKFKNLQINA